MYIIYFAGVLHVKIKRTILHNRLNPSVNTTLLVSLLDTPRLMLALEEVHTLFGRIRDDPGKVRLYVLSACLTYVLVHFENR